MVKGVDEVMRSDVERELRRMGAYQNNHHLWLELENADTGEIEYFEPQTMEELDRLLPRMCGNLIFDSEYKKNRYLDVAYLLWYYPELKKTFPEKVFGVTAVHKTKRFFAKMFRT